MEPLEGVEVVQGDFTTKEVQDRVRGVLAAVCGGGEGGGRGGERGESEEVPMVDVVLCDGAPGFMGNRDGDVERVKELCVAAFQFAESNMLKKDGSFVCKFLRGVGDKDLKLLLESKFEKVHFFKPNSSRKESAEAYYVCLNFNPSRKQQSEPEPNPAQMKHSNASILPQTTTEVPLAPNPPDWRDLEPGCTVLYKPSGKPANKQGGGGKLVEGIVESLVSRDAGRDGCLVRLTNGSLGRARVLVGRNRE
ncbi:hypothetical protein HDV05_004629 [Chytridiales sp. JEL 0842]|nr:hypothetical protein HDV05_004629 [Chytridiales sp. JEL 0842]